MDQFRTGAVIRYPYLWGWQADREETEGRKTRPVVVGLRIRKKSGAMVLALFPITTTEPSQDSFAVEIPVIEKRRAHLPPEIPMWLILEEFNTDELEHSFYLEPECEIGAFSRAFLEPILESVLGRLNEVRVVSRIA